MLFSILKNTQFNGTIDIIDAKGKHHSLGTGKPYVKIRFTTSSIQRKIYINPGLHIGEGYMNGELVIEEGKIEDFISIITSSYNNFRSVHSLYRFLESLFVFFRPLQQLNNIN